MKIRPTLKHGTNSCYSHGCRRDECRIAHREYEREAKRRRSRQEQGIDFYPSKFVSAEEVRQHLLFLSSKRIGVNAVSKVTGIGQSNILRIKRGEQKLITVRLADKILAIPAIPIFDGHYVDSKPAVKMMNAMIAAGYSRQQIASYLGIKDPRMVIKKTIRLSRLRTIEQLYKTLVRSKR